MRRSLLFDLDGTLVARALAMLPPETRKGAVMVGDMAVDGDDDAHNGIAFIACTWGYGSRSELLSHAPVAMAEDAASLRQALDICPAD